MNRKKMVWGVLTVVVIAVVVSLLVMIRFGSTFHTSTAENVEEINNSAELELIDVPLLSQHPKLPTGCESVAAVMVLNYYGEDVTSTDFASDWIKKSRDFYTYNGQSFGPDPEKAFAGDPFTSYGYGCYAGVIADAVNLHSTKCVAQEVRGKSLEYLCSEYVDKGIPLLVWATIDMTKSRAGESWVLPDGSFFTWVSGEHCLVLLGYDDVNYYFNDPNTGKTVGYEKSLTNMRFRELGSQAVVITPKNTM
ncbi:MAG: C39 family peptidase [Ruminococcus sp.]|nr:C39 family peptidase [Ruminococcus sp.]